MSKVINSVVYQRGKPRFSMSGKLMGDDITHTGKPISKSLTKKLYKYAVQEFQYAGLQSIVDNAMIVNIYTVADNDKVNDRYYHVDFINSSEFKLSVDGIMLDSKGKPFTDHGITI